MIKKSKLNTINELCNKLNIGSPQNITELYEYDNDISMYKITTSKSVYLIEEIKTSNKEKLTQIKNQLKVGAELQYAEINIVFPLKYEDNTLIMHKGKNYLFYDIGDLTIYTKKDMTIDKIKSIAKLLADVHLSEIPSDLPCYYHKVDIDFDKHLSRFKKINSNLYKHLYDNIFTLKDIVYKCNSSLQYLERNLSLDLGNYEINKILWKEGTPYVYDINSLTFLNPASSLAITSFYYSVEDDCINYEKYKAFLKEYIKIYGPLKVDFKDSLYVAVNSKLEILQSLLKKCNFISNQDLIDLIIENINELILYFNNINKMNDVYASLLIKKGKEK